MPAPPAPSTAFDSGETDAAASAAAASAAAASPPSSDPQPAVSQRDVPWKQGFHNRKDHAAPCAAQNLALVRCLRTGEACRGEHDAFWSCVRSKKPQHEREAPAGGQAEIYWRNTLRPALESGLARAKGFLFGGGGGSGGNGGSSGGGGGGGNGGG